MLFKKIELLCEKNEITISFLEKAVGLGNGTIRLWKDSSPKVSSLSAVASYFGVTLDDLVREE